MEEDSQGEHLAPMSHQRTQRGCSVYRAVNVIENRVAACKVMALNPSMTDKQRKSIDKEIRIHAALKHDNILEFLNAVVVEPKNSHLYFPGIYMLMELAGGGDLFDKIG